MKFEQKFNAYVKEKTIENWKFYLFSLILKPLFNNFVSTLNTSSKDDMERTFYEWQQKYCNLTQLRPSKFFTNTGRPVFSIGKRSFLMQINYLRHGAQRHINIIKLFRFKLEDFLKKCNQHIKYGLFRCDQFF